MTSHEATPVPDDEWRIDSCPRCGAFAWYVDVVGVVLWAVCGECGYRVELGT